MAVDLFLAKQHIRVLHDYEDAVINLYLTTAQAWVENYIGRRLDSFDPIPAVLDAAVLFLVADMDNLRGASEIKPAALTTVEALCHPYRPMLGGPAATSDVLIIKDDGNGLS